MGEVIPDDNYQSIILGSLPDSYKGFLISITNQINPMPIQIKRPTMAVGTVTIPEHDITITPPKISPEDLMEVLGQEAD